MVEIVDRVLQLLEAFSWRSRSGVTVRDAPERGRSAVNGEQRRRGYVQPTPPRLPRAARENRRLSRGPARARARRRGGVGCIVSASPLFTVTADRPRSGASRRNARARAPGERLPGAAARDRLSRHAPAGFRLVDADGEVSYLNATLSGWPIRPRPLRLRRPASRRHRTPNAAARPGHSGLPAMSAPKWLDVDLKRRNGVPLPSGSIIRSRSAATAAPVPRARWC